MCFFFFFQAEDGIRDGRVTGVQTCALPICLPSGGGAGSRSRSPPLRWWQVQPPWSSAADRVSFRLARRRRAWPPVPVLGPVATLFSFQHRVLHLPPHPRGIGASTPAWAGQGSAARSPTPAPITPGQALSAA